MVDTIVPGSPEDEARERKRRQRDRTLGQIGLLIAVIATVFAAITSQIAANKANANNAALQADQAVRDRQSQCTSQTLFSAIGALSDRAAYSNAQANANVELQKAQAALLLPSIKGHQFTPAEGQAALTKYFKSLTEYLTAATRNQNVAKLSPYPTPKQYASCLREAQDPDGPPPTIGPNPSTQPTP